MTTTNIDISKLTNSYNNYKSNILKNINQNCNKKDSYLDTFKDNVTGWDIKNKSDINSSVNKILEQTDSKPFPSNILIYKPMEDDQADESKTNEQTDSPSNNKVELIEQTIKSLQNSLPDDSNNNVNEECFVKCKNNILKKDTGCDIKCNLTSDYINDNINTECTDDTVINNQNCFRSDKHLVCITGNPITKCKINKINLPNICKQSCTENDNVDKQSCVKVDNKYYCSISNESNKSKLCHKI